MNAASCYSFQRRHRFSLCFPEPVTKGKPEAMKELETRAARQPLRIPELFRFYKERSLNSPHALNRLDISVLLPLKEWRGRGQLFAKAQFAFRGWILRNVTFLGDLRKDKTIACCLHVVANQSLVSFSSQPGLGPRTNTPRALKWSWDLQDRQITPCNLEYCTAQAMSYACPSPPCRSCRHDSQYNRCVPS